MKWRPAVFFHQNGLDEKTDLPVVAPKSFGDVVFLVTIGGHNDSYVIQIYVLIDVQIDDES